MAKREWPSALPQSSTRQIFSNVPLSTSARGGPTLIETRLFGPSVKSPMVPTLRGRGPEAPIWEAEAHELYSGTPDRAWKWLPTIDPDW